MPRRRKSNPLGYVPDPILAQRQMKILVSVLNRTPTKRRVGQSEELPTIRLELSEQQTELRLLVERWMKSGPNLRKLFARYPKLVDRTKCWEMFFYPTPRGQGYLDWNPAYAEANLTSPADYALRDFMTLITNPQWNSLGGPCRRCRNYFLKKTKRKGVYCSRSCSSGETAVCATRKWREREQAEKLTLAQRYIGEWIKVDRRLGWKVWVSNETGFTIRWLSRALNKGALRPPNERTKSTNSRWPGTRNWTERQAHNPTFDVDFRAE